MRHGIACWPTLATESIAAKGLESVAGITPATVVWPPGIQPLPPKTYVGNGRPPTRLQRAPGHEPGSVKELATSLPARAWQSITWRQGSNAALSSRLDAVRVRCAGGNSGRYRLQPEQWLQIQWLKAQAEPEKYYLSKLPDSTSTHDHVNAAHMRCRIERDYQDLKQDLGLVHTEGRGLRGIHHHATLSIATYGFLVAQHLNGDTDGMS
ncbi:transposase [Hydrogenophaga sp. OTU3427]|uniref:transposase n=1 Tax=Hydrogenophaga sp. OTU3427 TaxID=3043856 RepID=UPI00406CDC46